MASQSFFDFVMENEFAPLYDLALDDFSDLGLPSLIAPSTFVDKLMSFFPPPKTNFSLSESCLPEYLLSSSPSPCPSPLPPFPSPTPSPFAESLQFVTASSSCPSPSESSSYESVSSLSFYESPPVFFTPPPVFPSPSNCLPHPPGLPAPCEAQVINGTHYYGPPPPPTIIQAIAPPQPMIMVPTPVQPMVQLGFPMPPPPIPPFMAVPVQYGFAPAEPQIVWPRQFFY